ncbi:MAG: hypothetical protein NZL85_06570, partial [Fimbriimonadales bacterium]|nr:hypothetical protein [Fimbriimonadales bacterium]
MRTIMSCIGFLSLLMLAGAQSFTYQGFLRDGNSPANAPYDIQFLLFDAATGGSQIGPSVTYHDLQVQNGLFTVVLNFGSVWDGSARYLEIRVRPGASTGSYTILSPRVRVYPTPYAIWATAAGVANPSGPAGGDLSGSYPTPTVVRLQGRAVSSAVPTAGQVLKWDGSQWAPATDLWAVSGTNIYNTNTGNVGIGTSAPAYLLDVRGDRDARLMYIVNTNAGSLADGLYITVSGSGAWGLNSVATGTNSIAVRAVATATGAWAGYFVGRAHFSGDVGIGTTSPSTRLHVVGNRSRLEGGGKIVDLRTDGAAVDLESPTSSLF